MVILTCLTNYLRNKTSH